MGLAVKGQILLTVNYYTVIVDELGRSPVTFTHPAAPLKYFEDYLRQISQPEVRDPRIEVWKEWTVHPAVDKTGNYTDGAYLRCIVFIFNISNHLYMNTII